MIASKRRTIASFCRVPIRSSYLRPGLIPLPLIPLYRASCNCTYTIGLFFHARRPLKAERVSPICIDYTRQTLGGKKKKKRLPGGGKKVLRGPRSHKNFKGSAHNKNTVNQSSTVCRNNKIHV